MIKWYTACLLLLAVLTGCVNRRFYEQADYPFYSKGPGRAGASLLRTDGVYVLQPGAGNGSVQARMYKFYEGGQVNLILGISSAEKPEAIVSRINSEAVQRRTLFQGYYRNQDHKVVIQSINAPRRQFNYHYALLETDKLVIVASTIEGRGNFSERYFSNNFREVYVFKPLAGTFIKPAW